MITKVEELRREAQLSRNGLAQKARISAPTVKRAEKGLPISELTMVKLAAAFGKPVEYVFPPENRV